MTYDEHLFAMPKLYGAPAYARPPRPLVDETSRPVDPDDLPLEAFREDLAAYRDSDDPGSPPRVAEPGNGAGHDQHAIGTASLVARPFSLRSLGRQTDDR